MAAGSLERDAVAAAADRDVGDVHAGAVDRHEAIDLILQRHAEQLFHAAQVAESLFADVRDERDRPGRLDLRLLHLADDRDDDGEAAAVVADPGPVQHGALPLHLHVRAFRKDRVQVRRNHDARARGAAARIVAEHIPDLVDAHVLQTELLEHALQLLPPRLFLEWRRGYLADTDLVGDRVCASLAFAASSAALTAGSFMRSAADGASWAEAVPVASASTSPPVAANRSTDTSEQKW